MSIQSLVLQRGWGLIYGLIALLTLMPSCYISYKIGDQEDQRQIAEDSGFNSNLGAESIPGSGRIPGAGRNPGTGRNPEAGSIQPYEDITDGDAATLVCPTVQVRAPTARPNVILLIDSSFTMQDPFRETGETRWGAVRNALLNPNTGIVKPLEEKINFGLLFFGGSLELGCPFESKYEYILPASNNYAAIESAYPISMSSGVSYTPTGRALIHVCGTLPTQSVAAARGLGAYYIILATDGNPNGCPQIDFTAVDPPNDFNSAESAAQICMDRGIMVFPLSLADDIDQEHLQAMADFGSDRDNAVVYQPQDSIALRRDLEDLMGTVSCRIMLDITDGRTAYEIDEDRASCRYNGGSVTLDGVSIPCGPNGWVVSGSQAIELQGQACEDYENRLDALPTVSFPCEVFVPKS